VDDARDPSTRELRIEQVQRELRERRHAEETSDKDAVAEHERRADKAAYLREKLADRVRAENQAVERDDGRQA